MVLCISINLAKFYISEVGEFWWSFFFILPGERGVMDGNYYVWHILLGDLIIYLPMGRTRRQLVKINLALKYLVLKLTWKWCC